MAASSTNRLHGNKLDRSSYWTFRDMDPHHNEVDTSCCSHQLYAILMAYCFYQYMFTQDFKSCYKSLHRFLTVVIFCFKCFFQVFFIDKVLFEPRDLKQCGILTSVDSDEHVQPPFKLRNSK